MDTTDATNPETPEVEEVATADEAPSSEPDDITDDAEASDEEQAEASADEFIELEVNGKQIKIPKDVEPLLLMQKDYTQKTQTIAEERRAVEAEREAVLKEREVYGQVQREIHELDQIDDRLEYLRSIDPRMLPPPDLAQYTAELTGLQNKYTQLNQRVSARVEELQTQQAETEAKRNEANWKKVTTPNPAVFWDGKFDQTRSQELTQFGAESFGIKPEAMKNWGPEMVPMLNLAKIGLETLRKQQTALSKPKVEAKPVPEVVGKKSASPVTIKDADRLSGDKWLEWRNKQIAAKQARR